MTDGFNVFKIWPLSSDSTFNLNTSQAILIQSSCYPFKVVYLEIIIINP